MKEMSKVEKFSKSYLRVKVDAVNTEKLINYLLNYGVEVKNIIRNNAFSITFDIDMSDYYHLKDGVKKLNGKMEIVERRGKVKIYSALKHRKLFLVGIFIFFAIIFYLSRFIWKVDIKTDKYLAPLEVRNILKSYNIDVGTNKNSFDVKKVEEKLVRDIDEIMWIKVRVEGCNLTVEIVERQEPPQIRKVEYTGDIVAGKKGVVNRIYTSAGTATVKPNQVVDEGDVLVKGQEGKEGREFSVKAAGRVFATTFYEEILKVPKSKTVMERTGNRKSFYGINVNNKTIYLKKSLNNYENCDKIEGKWWIFVKETYYETKEVEVVSNTEEISKELENKVTLNLHRGAKVLDVKSEVLEEGDELSVRVLVTVEEDIAKSQEVIEETEQSVEENPNT